MMTTMKTSSVTTLEVSSDTSSLYATCKEKNLNEHLNRKKQSRKNATVGFVKGWGRTGFSTKIFKPGDFVCKYEAVVRKKEKLDWEEKTNAELGLECYCLGVTYEGVA